jgi:hypothetical protein
MMVDEAAKERFQMMFRGDVQFLEVAGMDLGNNPQFKVLVCPVVPPVPMVEIPQSPAEPPAPVPQA